MYAKSALVQSAVIFSQHGTCIHGLEYIHASHIMLQYACQKPPHPEPSCFFFNTVLTYIDSSFICTMQKTVTQICRICTYQGPETNSSLRMHPDSAILLLTDIFGYPRHRRKTCIIKSNLPCKENTRESSTPVAVLCSQVHTRRNSLCPLRHLHPSIEKILKLQCKL